MATNMRDGLEKESLTGAGLAAGGVFWVLQNYLTNLNPVATGVLTLIAFLTSLWLGSKLTIKFLKSEEGKTEIEIDKEWDALFNKCANEIRLDDIEKIARETELLISKQRNEVSSVDYHIRVRDSLYEHIHFQSLILGGKLQLKRQQNQRVSDIEKRAEELDYIVSKEVNDEGGVIVKMQKNLLLTTMEDMHQTVIAEENYLLEYLQKFPKIDKVEKDAVITSSSGHHHHRADFIATNTQGERYIIELKMTKNTSVAERRVKGMFVEVGAEMIGSQVLGEGALGTSIIFVGKIPSIEEE